MTIHRITCSGLMFGNQWMNVFHVETNDNVLQSDIANVIDADWVDKFKGFQHNGVSWLDIEVKQIADPNTPNVFHKTINKVGTGGPAAAADQVLLAVCFKFQTGLAGRRFRGRMFMPGLRAISQNLGILTAATLTAWQPTLDTVMLRMCGANPQSGVQLIICPRSGPQVGGLATPVISIIPRPTLATMRKRQYGVGA